MKILLLFTLNFIFSSTLSINSAAGGKSSKLHENVGKIDDNSTKLHHATTDPNSEQISTTIHSTIKRVKRQDGEIPDEEPTPELGEVEAATEPNINYEELTSPTTTTTRAPVTTKAVVTTKLAATTKPAAATTKPVPGATTARVTVTIIVRKCFTYFIFKIFLNVSF